MLKQYSIYDKKVRKFGPIMTLQTHGAAERMFLNTIKDGQGNIGMHPKDFDLYYVADFCDDTGKPIPTEHGPEEIITGLAIEQLANSQ